MTVIDGRTWLEVIQPKECWDLIATQPIGRLGILVGGFPEIYPINFVVDDRSIVFRTDPGSKLRGLLDSPRTCFEVDGADPTQHQGWSVMVKGRATRLTDPLTMARIEDLAVHPWARGEKSHWIRIEPIEVTGRRIRPLKVSQ